MNHQGMYHGGTPAFLEDYLELPELRRLRDVGMNCGCEYTSLTRFKGLKPYSRYDHSLGVALIVWHFTGDKAQTLAGLLHDVATPVFAHVVDFMYGDYLRQETTEAGTKGTIVRSSRLLELLTRDGLTVKRVCDYHRYPIADNDLPRLCADRLEYTLGNAINFGFCTEEEAAGIYSDLRVGRDEDGRPELAFAHMDDAAAFADIALQCAMVYVSDEDRYAMQRLSEVLKSALERRVIRENDLYTTEPEVISRLLADERAAADWNAFWALSRVTRSSRPVDGEGWRKIPAKKRYIDPLVLDKGRVSQRISTFRQRLDAFRSVTQDYWVLGE